YNAPGNKKIGRDLEKVIKEDAQSKRSRKKCMKIILGDFNSFRNNELDRKGKGKAVSAKNSILNYLIQNGFQNIYRELNPGISEFTWQKNASALRIDYIWADENAAEKAFQCRILQMDTITGSDHEMVLWSICTDIVVEKENKTE
ncbi:7602_t:CDS:1, partial [Gigaspora rosea]